jgi:tetratricopeptide (TPR) repeat protein
MATQDVNKLDLGMKCLRQPTKSIAIIFVHGILSDEGAWRHQNGNFWPDYVLQDPELDGIGVYIFNYKTGVFSGSYQLYDAATYLRETIDNDSEINNCKGFVFVCHSLGGIVTRQYIVSNQRWLSQEKKGIALLLIASPSRGSFLANLLGPIIKLFGNDQAGILMSRESNQVLNNLDDEFRNLREAKSITMIGKELTEDTFIFLRRILRSKVVSTNSASLYFGKSTKIPNTDHFSISKPHQPAQEWLQHRTLVTLIKEFKKILPEREIVILPPPPPPLPVIQISTNSVTFQIQNQQPIDTLHTQLPMPFPSGESIQVRPRLADLFEIISDPDDIKPALYQSDQHSGLQQYDLSYVNSRQGIPDTQAALDTAIRKGRGRILIRGQKGIGKTREVSELATVLCRKFWKVLIAKNGKDLQLGPIQDIPPELFDSKILVVVDNIHRRVLSTADQPIVPYIERLKHFLTDLERRLPDGFFFITTTRDELGFAKLMDLGPDKKEWNSLHVVSLPNLTDDGLKQILRQLSIREQVNIPEADIDKMIANSDRKPETIFINVVLARDSGRGLSEQWRPTEGESWKQKFQTAELTYPHLPVVFRYLKLFSFYGVPARISYLQNLFQSAGGQMEQTEFDALVADGLLRIRHGALTAFSDEQLNELAGKEFDAVDHEKNISAITQSIVGAGADSKDDLLTFSQTLIKLDRLSEAETIVNQVIEQDNGIARAYEIRGFIRYARTTFETAIEDLDRSLAIDDKNSTTFFLLGVIRLFQTRYKEAIEAFESGISTGNNSGDAHVQIGTAYYQMKEWLQAKIYFTKGIELGKDDASIFYTRAIASMQLQEIDDSEADFSICLDKGFDLEGTANQLRAMNEGRLLSNLLISPTENGITKGRAFVFAMRGNVRFMQKNYTGTESDLTQAIEGKADEHIKMFMSSMQGSSIPLLQGVNEQFSTAPELSFIRESFLLIRGQARMQLGKYKDALDDLSEVLKSDFNKAATYCLRAWCYYHNREYDLAEQDVALAIAQGLNTGEVHFLLGLCRYSLQKYPSSSQSFDLAVELEPENGDYWGWRGMAYSLSSRAAEAENYLTKAISIKEDLTFILQRGAVRFDAQNLGDAEKDFSRAIELGFISPKSFTFRGLCRLSLGDIDGANDDMIKAFEMGANDVQAYSLRAEINLEKKMYAEAEADLSQCIELGREDTWVYYHRGTSRRIQEKFDLAEEDFSAVLRLDASLADAYFDRGICRSELLKWGLAEEDLRMAIQLGIQSVVVHMILGDALKNQMRFSAAEKEYSAAIELDQNYELYGHRGSLRLLAGNFLGAEEDLDIMIATGPANERTYYLRGFIRYAQLKDDKALEDLNEALKRSPEDKEFLGLRVLVYCRMDDLDKAGNDVNFLLGLEKESANSLGSQGAVHFAKGEHEEALQHFRKASKEDYTWRIWEGLTLLMSGQYKESLDVYQSFNADQSPEEIIYPGDFLNGQNNLIFYVNKNQDKFSSLEAKSAIETIQSELRRKVDKMLETTVD